MSRSRVTQRKRAWELPPNEIRNLRKGWRTHHVTIHKNQIAENVYQKVEGHLRSPYSIMSRNEVTENGMGRCQEKLIGGIEHLHNEIIEVTQTFGNKVIVKMRKRWKNGRERLAFAHYNPENNKTISSLWKNVKWAETYFLIRSWLNQIHSHKQHLRSGQQGRDNNENCYAINDW